MGRPTPRAAIAALALAALGGAAPGPRAIEPFRLADAKGGAWSLADRRGAAATVVVFVGAECPISAGYAAKLGEVERAYRGRGVAVVGVDSNDVDTPEDVDAFARAHGLDFPVLRDPGQAVARAFGAERVPEAFVLDGELAVRYRGRVDDQIGVGYRRPRPTREDLTIALDEVLAGREVSTPATPVAGCFIARARPGAAGAAGRVTFAKDVARVVQDRCQSCHRPGQIGPMPLMTAADAAPWADTIREVVSERRMPPWHADPAVGAFANDRSLSKAESDLLLAWVDGGCPAGDPADLPPPRTFADGWNIGEPDVVLSMPAPYRVPAKAPAAGLPYKEFKIPTNFGEDRYIQAFECRPGAVGVVHHILITLIPPGGGGTPTPLATWVPGDRGLRYPDGLGKLVPKGSTLRMQMHYTPDGVAREDRSSVAFVFAKETPRLVVRPRYILNFTFEIPPGAADHAVKAATTFKKDVLVWDIMPHMHLRGRSFVATAILPDGRREPVLSVPRYDFGWQTTYVLAAPLRLPAGSKLEVVGRFDNSAGNPNNPDPTVAVGFGEQTWEEMLACVVDVTDAPASPAAPIPAPASAAR